MKNLLALAVLAGTAASAHAQGQTDRENLTNTLSNWNQPNNTGQVANDFHLTLLGVTPGSVCCPWTGDYPNAVITGVPGGTKISWTGSSTLPNDEDHFGIQLTGNAEPANVIKEWTFNGVVIGDNPDIWQNWDVLPQGVLSVINNRSTETVRIQRRINTTTETVTLADLNVGDPLWETAQIIDLAPVPVSPGGQLSFEFPYHGEPLINFVMMYSVTDQGGLPLITSLDAATVESACPCACNYDTTTGQDVCDIFDFLAFQNLFDAGDPCACNEDTSTGQNVCNIFDFLAFQNGYDAGCP